MQWWMREVKRGFFSPFGIKSNNIWLIINYAVWSLWWDSKFRTWAHPLFQSRWYSGRSKLYSLLPRIPIMTSVELNFGIPTTNIFTPSLARRNWKSTVFVTQTSLPGLWDVESIRSNQKEDLVLWIWPGGPIHSKSSLNPCLLTTPHKQSIA